MMIMAIMIMAQGHSRHNNNLWLLRRGMVRHCVPIVHPSCHDVHFASLGNEHDLVARAKTKLEELTCRSNVERNRDYRGSCPTARRSTNLQLMRDWCMRRARARTRHGVLVLAADIHNPCALSTKQGDNLRTTDTVLDATARERSTAWQGSSR